MSKISFGIDVGGTFTDFVVFDHETGKYFFGKRLSTPENPSRGILAGVADLCRSLEFPASSIDHIVHGTTIVANQIIERKGAVVGLITTKGFRDSLELGREQRYDMYDLFIKKAAPLVPRFLRAGVSERIDWDGNVLRPIRIEELNEIMSSFEQESVRSVAVCLIHAYRNSEHELKIRDYLNKTHPGLYVSISSEVSPEVREHERTSTTVANAYVQPAIDRYLDGLERGFEALESKSTIYIMLSGGGITTIDMARRAPVRMVESGPAAGAIAGSFYAKLCGEPNIVSFDMGGTTAKICLINNDVPTRTSELEVAREHRFKKGSGLVLKVPSIEMIEIGAGGGSIAFVDSMGLLKVGPESAGADPGPACYALGGRSPTITDADLLLGFLNSEFFLGGEMKLNKEEAFNILKEKVANPLDLDVIDAARGMTEVVDENMAAAAKTYASERGVDIRDYAMVAFGGAGPVHAYKVAKVLGIKRIICPLGAGVMSSIGMMVAPKSIDFVQSYIVRIENLNWEHLDILYGKMEESAVNILTESGVDQKDICFTRTADMRYVGQGSEISVTIPEGLFASKASAELTVLFSQSYRNLYKRHLTHVPVEAITWRLTASEPVSVPELNYEFSQSPEIHDRIKTTRPVYLFEYESFVDVPVYDRYSLTPGFTCKGPVLIEERESTVVVGPNCSCRVDDYYNAIIDLEFP
jgi:N-methylhydantoinase A